MASEEQGQPLPSMPPSRSELQQVGRRNRRLVFGTLLGGVLFVAIVGAVCVAATIAATKPSSGQKTISGADKGETRQRSAPTEYNQAYSLRQRRRNRRAISSTVPTRPTPAGGLLPPARNTMEGSCMSTATNSNIPAAHIKARSIHRGKWTQSTSDSGSVVPGYQQKWQCNDVYSDERHHIKEQAFVDGGVWFNQTDKSIYVPKCGYYHIYSQVLFVLEKPTNSGITVFHNLKIRHNCSWERDAGPIQLQAKASVPPFGPSDTNGRVATTFTSDIVHMCPGGNVWIEIPDGGNGIPCCPRGEESATFLGLILIADTPCSSWPPNITMTHSF